MMNPLQQLKSLIDPPLAAAITLSLALASCTFTATIAPTGANIIKDATLLQLEHDECFEMGIATLGVRGGVIVASAENGGLRLKRHDYDLRQLWSRRIDLAENEQCIRLEEINGNVLLLTRLPQERTDSISLAARVFSSERGDSIRSAIITVFDSEMIHSDIIEHTRSDNGRFHLYHYIVAAADDDDGYGISHDSLVVELFEGDLKRIRSFKVPVINTYESFCAAAHVTNTGDICIARVDSAQQFSMDVYPFREPGVKFQVFAPPTTSWNYIRENRVVLASIDSSTLLAATVMNVSDDSIVVTTTRFDLAARKATQQTVIPVGMEDLLTCSMRSIIVDTVNGSVILVAEQVTVYTSSPHHNGITSLQESISGTMSASHRPNSLGFSRRYASKDIIISLDAQDSLRWKRVLDKEYDGVYGNIGPIFGPRTVGSAVHYDAERNLRVLFRTSDFKGREGHLKVIAVRTSDGAVTTPVDLFDLGEVYFYRDEVIWLDNNKVIVPHRLAFWSDRGLNNYRFTTLLLPPADFSK